LRIIPNDLFEDHIGSLKKRHTISSFDVIPPVELPALQESASCH
jgi:hypothetical protein